MAYKRRSQEEKNLKTLRELASLPANKQCFDCNQRGPTYVNVTIGSFICTSCSGILRGLNPPHRVKSITMTTFQPEEIELVRNRGNEYCNYVWLGTYKGAIDTDSRDEHRSRDFMIQKYEKKRWYVEPEVAIKKMQANQKQLQNNHQQQPPPPQPLQQQIFNKQPPPPQPSKVLPHQVTVPESKPSPLVISNSQSQPLSLWPPFTPASQSQGSLDLFSTDLFSSPVSSSKNNSTVVSNNTANGNFANFEGAFNSSEANVPSPTWSNSPQPPPLPTSFNFPPALPTSNPGLLATASNVSATNNLLNNNNNNVSQQQQQHQSYVDKYAALADLDTLFHSSTTLVTNPAAPPAPVPTNTTKPDSFVDNFNELHMTSDPDPVFSSPPSNPFTAGTNPWSQPPPPPPQQQQPFPPAANPFQGYFSTPLNNRDPPPPSQNGVSHQNGTIPNWTANWGGLVQPSMQSKTADVSWPPQMAINANPFLTSKPNPGRNPFL